MLVLGDLVRYVVDRDDQIENRQGTEDQEPQGNVVENHVVRAPRGKKQTIATLSSRQQVLDSSSRACVALLAFGRIDYGTPQG